MKVPWSSESPSLRTLVATLVMVTVTPGITAPDGSLTVPRIAPVKDCARTRGITARTIASKASFFIIAPFDADDFGCVLQLRGKFLTSLLFSNVPCSFVKRDGFGLNKYHRDTKTRRKRRTCESTRISRTDHPLEPFGRGAECRRRGDRRQGNRQSSRAGHPVARRRGARCAWSR